MKKFMLLILLAALAGQSASAAIRTFEYTAAVDGFVYNDSFPHQTVPGVVDGSTVSAGDTFTGWFSFDDAGFDWSKPDSLTHPAISAGMKFADGVTIEVANPNWSVLPRWPNFVTFGIGGESAEGVLLNTVISSSLPFSWESNGSGGNVAMRWVSQGAVVYLNADVTALKEVGVSPVPEPSTYAMLLLGAAVLTGAAKRRAGRGAA